MHIHTSQNAKDGDFKFVMTLMEMVKWIWMMTAQLLAIICRVYIWIYEFICI